MMLYISSVFGVTRISYDQVNDQYILLLAIYESCFFTRIGHDHDFFSGMVN